MLKIGEGAVCVKKFYRSSSGSKRGSYGMRGSVGSKAIHILQSRARAGWTAVRAGRSGSGAPGIGILYNGQLPVRGQPPAYSDSAVM